ncbi:MAG TPA: VWA domain-containing protein [Bryobacteraceae bacterium]|nr:VWA domain-containing protein [Bryobacteraceae bacterium]
MGLFSPWFLAALAGLALPLYLHLLKRQTRTPKHVSSLMFFESRTQSSTRHRRLNYLLLLSLRLLLLLALILAFANPFVNRNAATLASGRLVLLVVDNSFSMRAGTRLEDAKASAISLLAGKGAARGQVATFGSQLHLLTQPVEDQVALRVAIQSIQPGDGHGNFGELARAVRAMAESVRTPIELHLFSDMQRTEAPANFTDIALPANVKLSVHPVTTRPQPNWTVESVDAPGQVWGKDAKPVHVQAVIAGYGTPAAQRTASLVVNGKTTATKAVQVPANGKATVEFPALEVPYGFSRCEVKIDSADGFAADDLRRFAVERSDPQKALLVHNYGDNRSPLYIGAALTAAAQSAFTLESINVNEAADRKPSNYAFIILSDLNSLPSLLENSLTGYVRSGGSLLITVGTSAGSRSQIPIFGAHINQTRDYSRIPDRFMSVGSTDSSYPGVGKADGWAGVKFFYALDVDPGNGPDAARIVVRLADQTPLLLDKRIGEGRVVLLTSGLDNLTNDFPLHPAFVPFIEQTSRYLAGSERQGGARSVDAYLELRNAKEKGQGVEVTDPEGKRPLSLSEAASAQSFQLAEAGYYQLRLANGRQDLVGVNADPKESNLDVMSNDVLALWQGNGGPSSQEAQPAGAAPPRRTPQSFWWYVMLLVLASAVAESALASRYLGTQREET